MKWFGWKSAGRGDPRPVLSRGWAARSVGAYPAGYEAQVRAAYLDNAIAQRAVRLVADGLGAVPLTVSAPEIERLFRARSGGQALLSTLAAQMLLHGNAYIQVLTDGEGRVAELYALRPERVSAVMDAGGWPVAYAYKVGERTTRLAAEDPAGRVEVVHIKAFHPLDDHAGLGCLGAAAGAIAVHNAAARWNAALLGNAARPSGALVYDPADGAAMSSEQFARLKAEMEAGFSGAANAGRPMLLEGGLKWQALSLTPADMDFAGMRDAGGARDRDRVRGAADAARPARRRDLCQLPRGEPGIVAPRDPAARRDDPVGAGAGVGGVVSGGGGCGGSRPGDRAGGGSRAVVGAGERRRFPEPRREARVGRIRGGAGRCRGRSGGAGRADRRKGGGDVTGAILAQLLSQTAEGGADLIVLRAIAEEAGELGASRALSRLGLDDAGAAKDMAELRELLTAWREAKKSMWQAVFGWTLKMVPVILMAGFALKFGLHEFAK
jgi:hypothetical protein